MDANVKQKFILKHGGKIMVVQHNLRAMNSNRMLGLTASIQSKATERLSSGYKINRAADDAAGLSISEKMRGQIRGLSQASLNAQDGISLIQTAEGALNESHSILQRMRELSVKAANGIYTDEDRTAVNDEINQLQEELTRISETTEFNTMKLLDGSKATEATGVSQDGNITTGSAVAKLAAAEVTVTATGTSVAATDFVKETINIDGAEIEVDWSQLSESDKAVLNRDWSGAATKAEAKAAAQLIQDTINKAIKDSGHSVADITVTAQDNGAGATTFKFKSGSEGVDSKVALSASAAGVLNKITTDTTGVTDNDNDGIADEFTATGTTKYAGEDIAVLPEEDSLFANGVNGVDASGATTTAGAATSKKETLNIDGVDISFTIDFDTNLAKDLTAVADTTGAGTWNTYADSVEAKINAAIDEYNTNSNSSIRHIDIIAQEADGTNAAKFAITGAAVKGTNTLTGNATGVLSSLGFTSVYDNGIAEPEKMMMEINGESLVVEVADIAKDDDMANVANTLQTSINDAIAKYNVGRDEEEQFKDVVVSVTDDGRLSVNSESGAVSFKDLEFQETAKNLGLVETKVTGKEAGGGISLQIGANEGQMMTFGLGDMSAEALGVGKGTLDLSTQDTAKTAMTTIDEAIKKVSQTRGTMGAIQNRLEHTIANLDNVVENTTAAESQIRDTDMASEMVKFSNSNILAQAGQAMLAQANQANQGVLSLLG